MYPVGRFRPPSFSRPTLSFRASCGLYPCSAFYVSGSRFDQILGFFLDSRLVSSFGPGYHRAAGVRRRVLRNPPSRHRGVLGRRPIDVLAIARQSHLVTIPLLMQSPRPSSRNRLPLKMADACSLGTFRRQGGGRSASFQYSLYKMLVAMCTIGNFRR